MPLIARFYGIVVKMYFNDHLPPHFHAIYGEYVGVYSIASCELLEGDLPARADVLVREWTEQHKSELARMWETKDFHQLAGLQ
jgi:hypothetical protein